ncbi:hypothetical protein BOX15_Mlig027527g3 [Macrostomum lignano]|uniref:Uncharacterized protein n=1 Tax=Macrostomum lignano TaxID=282301 RepID=A0A267H0R3_9PLAT|nr:hypothetical protein BOX15_Mlig027527g3 [Macrostomum lignano]
MTRAIGDVDQNQLDAIVASETNRLVLRDGSSSSNGARPHHSPPGPVVSGPAETSATSAAEALAPGIVGAVAFFAVMFALVAAYWRCGRLDDDRRRRIRRRCPRTPAVASETEGGGCRIIINPLEEEIEMKPRAPGVQPGLTKLSSRRQHSKNVDNQDDASDDFDDLASLLSSSTSSRSSCDGDSSSGEDEEVDANCEQCRREARLASPEEAAADSEEEEDDEDCCFDATDHDIGFADEDEDEVAADEADGIVDDAAGSESVRLIRGGAC